MQCAKCGKETTKISNGTPVCTKCFIQGWARLPDMMPEVKPYDYEFTLSPGHTFADITEEVRNSELVMAKVINPEKPKRRIIKHRSKK